MELYDFRSEDCEMYVIPEGLLTDSEIREFEKFRKMANNWSFSLCVKREKECFVIYEDVLHGKLDLMIAFETIMNNLLKRINEDYSGSDSYNSYFEPIKHKPLQYDDEEI